MLAKRVIPCLDILNNTVVKGVQFRNHEIIGHPVELAQSYADQGADELVFYDITASSDQRTVLPEWISKIAKTLDIPFTVAGGIRSLESARAILNAGADKISINSPALADPDLINCLSDEFGCQCVVLGIDSQWVEDDYYVYQYTGDVTKSLNSRWKTTEWIREVQQRGAGEIVLNCMQADGVRSGYELSQLTLMRELCNVPLIASGGAGSLRDFVDLFQKIDVSGALAASVFHKKLFTVGDVKQILAQNKIEVRL